MKALLFATATAAALGTAPLVAAPPAATGTGWDLVFADEFSGPSLDTMKGWIDAYPWGRTQLAGSGGAANASVEALATSQANQTVNSRVELYNSTDLRNNMTGGQLLVLGGVIVGDGGLSVDGAGTVQFSNNNTYTGDTVIDPGTQGPAVARVTRSRPFGTVGTVMIGPSGNATRRASRFRTVAMCRTR